ncbi:MAG: VWA domain-containing protein [Dehalococcoidales bacterium]|nr:VWA domain-containing protein [Dehalococcoidales bacterium]
MSKYKFIAVPVILALVLSLGVGLAPPPAVADYGGGENPCTIMHPDRDTLEEWMAAFGATPKLEILPPPSLPTSYTVLPLLTYTPVERNQGSCGNCWVWAGTGILGIALNVQQSIADRLSIQYLDSCWTGSPWACCGGFIAGFADFYDPIGVGQCIPWSNTNASYADAAETCGTAPSSVTCGSIGTTPNYGITNCDDVVIPTHAVGQTTAIDNIKTILNQDRGVWFAFYLCNNTQWTAFRDFWNTGAATALWDPDPYCGCTWNPAPGEGGGHAVLCVGYDCTDAEPANHYWIILNSWGTTANRTDGLFRMKMNIDYDCTFLDPPSVYWMLYWETLDVTFAEADLEVTEKYEEWVDPGAGTYEVTYTVTNTGDILAPASTTRVTIDGTPSDYSCPELQPGEFDTNTVGPFTLAPTSDTINVCADSEGVVPESNEGNNCLENEWPGSGLEFGDAPDGTYPSLLASDGARHLPTQTECLGLAITEAPDWKDFEPDANVPDLDLYDDGLVTTTITTDNPAQTVTFQVTDLMVEGDLYVNILIDLNADGDWLDTVGTQSEHVVVNQVLPAVQEQTVVSNPFSTVGATPGTTWLRITLTRSPLSVAAPWDGTMAGYAEMTPFTYGETEDWEIEIIKGDLEYGDAPDPGYPSTLASDGARHDYTRTEFLGDDKDGESDANQPDLDLLDDGLLTTTITAGLANQQVQFKITDDSQPSTDLVINILIDLNCDGDWNDAGEHVVQNQPIATTVAAQTFFSSPFSTVGATPGATWLRITLTRSDLGGLPWDGTMTGHAAMIPFEYGETEDWLIDIASPPEVIPPWLTVNKWVTPAEIWQKGSAMEPEQATVTLTVIGEGQIVDVPNVDIIFALDSSGSMTASDPTGVRRTGSKDFVDSLDPTGDQVGVVSWDSAIDFFLDLTSDFALVKANIDNVDDSGGTDLDVGLSKAIDLLDAGARVGTVHAIVFLTDGDGTYIFSGNAGSQADRAAAAGYQIYAIGLDPPSGAIPKLEDMADTTGGKYCLAATAADIEACLDDILGEITNVAGQNVTVYDILPSYINQENAFTIAPDSITPNPDGTTTLVWDVGTLLVGEIWRVSFNISSDLCGSWLLVDVPYESGVFYITYAQEEAWVPFPARYIDVLCPVEEAPARLIVRNLLIQPAQAYPGEPVTITADVVNQGGIRGNKNIELVINGQAEQSTRVGVDPGCAQHITFFISKTVPGTYEVYIEGQESAFNVLLRPHVTSTGVAGGLGTGAIIAIVVIGVIFLIGIIIISIRVRRSV